MLRDAWKDEAATGAPGHDSYWLFHRDAFLSLVPPPGCLTLDIGCGEGRLSRDLVRLGHRVVGIDGSMTLAAAASSHPEALNAFVQADAAQLPLPDCVAGCAIMFMSLQDIDGMDQAIGEVARVLRDGGYLVIATSHPSNTAGTFEASNDDSSPPFVIRGS